MMVALQLRPLIKVVLIKTGSLIFPTLAVCALGLSPALASESKRMDLTTCDKSALLSTNTLDIREMYSGLGSLVTKF